jgi:hypothetical protein
MQLVRFGEPPSQYTPPPESDEFPEIVQLVRVGEELPMQYTPPPYCDAEFPEIVQFVRVGEDPGPQYTPPPPEYAVFLETVQFVIEGLSPRLTAIPPQVPFVTVRFESIDPVCRPKTVPSSTVVCSPEPRRLTLCAKARSSDL